MRLTVIITASFLAGCASKPAVPVAAPTNPDSLEIIERLHGGTVSIGKVEGLSCDAGFLYVVAGRQETALAIAKRQAAALGADGLAEVEVLPPKSVFACATRDGVRVTAVAYRNARD